MNNRPPNIRRVAALAAAGALAVPALAPTLTAASAASTSTIPPLSGAPKALAHDIDSRRTPLVVALPDRPSTSAVRAAAIASGAVAKAAGIPGISTTVAASSDAAQSAAGPVLAIHDQRAPSTLTLTRLRSGSLELTVSGSGAGLLRAARALSSPWLAGVTGDTARVPRGVGPELRSAPVPAGARIAPSATGGRGSLTLKARLWMPIERVISSGQAALRLGVEYDAPAGGRVVVSLNGNRLGAFNASSDGPTLRVLTFKLASNWTDSGDLLPGYYLQPGRNELTVTAQPRGRETVPAHLSIAPHSALTLTTEPRPATEQVGLWPFPLYGKKAWSDSTVVLPARADADTLGALIGALANSERLTGVAPDPAVTYRAPTARQRAGNLLVVGDPLTLASLVYHGRLLPGMLAEMPIPYGGVALIATNAHALGVLGLGFEPGRVNGRAVLIDPAGQPHTLVAAPGVSGFADPTRPWLAPAAVLALLVLGWLGFKIRKARGRLEALPELKSRPAKSRPEKSRPEKPRPAKPRPEKLRPEKLRPEKPRPEKPRPEKPRPVKGRA